MEEFDKGSAELSSSIYDSMYQRNPNSYNSNKTVVADDYRELLNQEEFTDTKHHQIDNIADYEISNNDKPLEKIIVGVLYSVSRNMNGEVFPIYLGENRIGCDPQCEIRLMESSVSSEHAIITVWRNENCEAEYEMSISDLGSFYGTQVGDTTVNYGTLNVRDDDIITIGLHYRLILKIFEPKRYFLMPDKAFVPLINVQNNGTTEQVPLGTIDADFYMRNNQDNIKHTVLYEDTKH